MPSIDLLRQAEQALQRGELDLATAHAEALLAREPKHAVASNLLGRASLQRFQQSASAEDAKRAERWFMRALEANPSFWPALQNQAELAEHRGDTARAASLYRQVLAVEPNHPRRVQYQK